MSIRDLRGPAFASKRNIGNAPVAPWVRPASWTALPDVTGLQKFAGLHAVFPDSNFVALSADGNFTVDWGDGTGTTNVSSGVTAEYNIPYANAATTSDVGIASAVACTFTDAGDTVGLTAHGWDNGQQVAFNTITSTTGISTYTTYFIVNKAADTFQVATTAGGSALTLTTNGSGNVYVPQYRQVIVTVVPNGGNITKLDLHIKHSTSGLQVYSSGFLDVAISAQYMTDLRFGVQTPGGATQVISHSLLQQFNLVASDLRQLRNLLYTCRSLESIQNVVTSSTAAASASCTFTDSTDTVGLTAHDFRDGDNVIFTAITSTTGITKDTAYFVRDKAADTFKVASTYGDTALTLTTDGTGTVVRGTNFVGMFTGCYSLTSVPLFNTAAGTSFGSMFNSCFSLASVPLFNTAAGTSFSSMFTSCFSLASVPLFNTAAGTSFGSMFNSCFSLASVPLFNTAAGTNFVGMFTGCYSLASVPLFNTAAGTNFTSMFNSCYSLASVPLFNTAAGTNFTSMFNSCYSLASVPLLNTAAGTNFTTMFSVCYSLTSVPLFVTSGESTNYANMFSTCSSLKSAALSGTANTISYAFCELSAAELNKIYTGLATATKTITVSNNWGTASDDTTIATTKNWTVTG